MGVPGMGRLGILEVYVDRFPSFRYECINNIGVNILITYLYVEID
jgi:hypothetical protein